jgi:aminoglycoside phosphotransferase (APT) family kinase protein
MHDEQLDVPSASVRLLVAEHPAWADLAVTRLTTAATVHAVFRVGETLSARFPLQRREPAHARAALESEAEAAARFAAASPFPAPEPVALGEPGHGYPLPWSVQTWAPGGDASGDDLGASLSLADGLAALLAALRDVDTGGRRFPGTGRGGHLPDHDPWMELCLRRSVGLLDVAELREVWHHLRALPRVDEDAMTHGDLTPANVLVERGRLVGVIDTGGFAPADPALDLVSMWHLLDEAPRERVRQTLGCGDVQWLRGMAWAFEQALGLVWYYAGSNPTMSRCGRRTLDRILTSPELDARLR